MVIKRGEMYLMELDPTIGSEIRKTRPALVVSPDEMNGGLRTIIIAPMTTAVKQYPSRVSCRFDGKHGAVALDQIRSVDVSRIKRKLGRLPDDTVKKALRVLMEMFTP